MWYGSLLLLFHFTCLVPLRSCYFLYFPSPCSYSGLLLILGFSQNLVLAAADPFQPGWPYSAHVQHQVKSNREEQDAKEAERGTRITLCPELAPARLGLYIVNIIVLIYYLHFSSKFVKYKMIVNYCKSKKKQTERTKYI